MTKRKFHDLNDHLSINPEYWSGYIRYSSKIHTIYESKRKYYRVYSTPEHLQPLAIKLKTTIHHHTKGYWIKIHKILPAPTLKNDISLDYLRGCLEAIARPYQSTKLILSHRYLDEFVDNLRLATNILLPDPHRSGAYSLRVVLPSRLSKHLVETLAGQPYNPAKELWTLLDPH